MIKGKSWGTTEDLLSTGIVEVHRIRVVGFGHSSWHHHERKHNGFVLVSGSLDIEVDEDPGATRNKTRRTCVTLKAGDFTTVPPGAVHRFVCGTGSGAVALELYYPDALSEDIVRRDLGGVL